MVYRLLSGGVVALTMAAGLLVVPGPHASPLDLPTSPALSLPPTGPAGAITRVRIWRETTALEPSEQLYERFIPPPPPPPPPPPAQVWVLPAGYVTIPVPIYRQAYALDCETSALRMGLATFGYYYTDSALFALENPDLRPPVMGANHTVLQWGDPYTNFVGDVNGSDYTPTGYGIYYPPIVAIARSHGLPNTVGGEGFAVTTIYAALQAGHPVEVWVETGWARPALGTWTAWDGRRVRYSLVEHVVTLSGVSPWSVRVNDPLYGSQYWIGKATFEAVWADFNNMAVIFQ